MKNFVVKNSQLQGNIQIPPSKSHTLRALIFAFMAKGKSKIEKYLESPDTFSMIKAIETFGAKVEVWPKHLIIEGIAGNLQPAENIIDAGNSGQVLRFIGALSPLSPSYTVITGDHSIRHQRPIQPMLDALSQLGAFATSTRQDGYAPILLKGPMQPGIAKLNGMDSQPVSALIIATAFLPGQSIIHVTNPGEKPWIDLTLYWLKKFNLSCTCENYERYVVPGSASLEGFSYCVPGDFSSAAFPIAAALITDSDLTLSNIDMNDIQGDKKLIEVLIQMGAKIEVNDKEKTIRVHKGSHLVGEKIHINDFVDAVAIFAVIGCFAEGTTEIVGAEISRQKESDRIQCITIELKKMGADIEERSDGFLVKKSKLYGAKVYAHNDHRIAMSLAIAGFGAKGETLIEDVDCVKKTYPTFVRDFQKINAEIKEKL